MRSFIFFWFILLAVGVCGQRRYELDFAGKTLYEAVEELTKKYKFKFSYNPSALKEHELDRKIRANTEAELISQVFDELPFKIQLSDGIYLVIPKKLNFKPSKLAGQVKDQSTGKPLAFAHVQVNNEGTISNQDGRFTLPPREDTISIEISYIGYKSIQLEVPPTQNELALKLEQNPMVLQEVILNSKEFNDLASQPGFFSLNPDQFNALPTLGETDVFKSIQLLPGIKATDETSSGLSIRGGTPAQNLITMDGFTLYHLDHFFGIFSTLNPNVINNVNVHKGGFGPEFGGRISSVVDVAGKTGSTESFSAKAGINLLSFHGMIETPIGDKTSLLLGTRQSFTSVLSSDLFKDFLSSNREGFLGSINPEIPSLNITPSLNFYDINGKLHHQFNDRSMIDINLYVSEDNYKGDFLESEFDYSFGVEDVANWSNSGISANWQYDFSSKWHSTFTFGTSEYSDEEQLSITETYGFEVEFSNDTIAANTEIESFAYRVNSLVTDATIRSDHEIEISDQHHLGVGFELNNISTDFDSNQEFYADFTNGVVIRDTYLQESNISSLYTSYKFVGDNIRSNIGLRGTYYDPTTRWYAEPRFDITFKINDLFSLKGAASFHHQFVNQTSLSFFNNTDKFYWVLADDESIPILKGSHLILGGNFSTENWTFDVEYYRKNTDGILENLFVTRTPELLAFFEEDELNFSGENIAEGLDLFIKYRNPTFTSWVSYSLASSENRFWYIDQNNPFPSNQDQRHEINFVNVIKVGNWEFSNILVYGSGRPYTVPLVDDDEIFYDPENVNNNRLPAYSRFDLSAKNSFNIGNAKCEAGITFFNVFDTRNIKSRRFASQLVFDEVDSSIDDDEFRIVSLDTYLLGFTPNFFLTISF